MMQLHMKMEYLSQFIYNLSWRLHPHSSTGYLMAKWQISSKSFKKVYKQGTEFARPPLPPGVIGLNH